MFKPMFSSYVLQLFLLKFPLCVSLSYNQAARQSNKKKKTLDCLAHSSIVLTLVRNKKNLLQKHLCKGKEDEFIRMEWNVWRSSTSAKMRTASSLPRCIVIWMYPSARWNRIECRPIVRGRYENKGTWKWLKARAQWARFGWGRFRHQCRYQCISFAAFIHM